LVLDHIGIAVRDADSALAGWLKALGLEESHRETIEGQGILAVSVPLGDATIELLQPVDPDGPVARFIESRGEGIHHVALRVLNLEEALDGARESGLGLVDEKPREGAGGARIAFLHPRSTGGVLVELVERG